jgi:hypothetical protein
LHISAWMLTGTAAAEFAYVDPGVVTIGPGDSIAVAVTFSPLTYGPKTAALEVSSDDLANGLFPMQLRGNATTLSTGDVPVAIGVTLQQNYPNPVSLMQGGQTRFGVTLPREMQLSLALHDVLGRHVRTIFEGVLEAGTHTLRTEMGSLPSGSYHAVLRAVDSGGHIVQRQVQTIIMH